MGVESNTIIGQLSNPHNVFVQIAKEEDFISVIARGNYEILGVPF